MVDFFCAIEDTSHCQYQCHMCKDKEEKRKMATSSPYFLMVATFKDNKPQYLFHSSNKEDVVAKATELLEKDSTVDFCVCYKPIAKIERFNVLVTWID